MKQISLFGLVTILAFSFLTYSCSKKTETPAPDPLNLQDGQTGVISNANLIGKGQIVNRANTTIVISGNVIVDDLTVIGTVKVNPNSSLTIKGLLTVAGGAKMHVMSPVKCDDLTLTGDIFIDETSLEVNGQYTAAGGTNTYLENAFVKVNDLRILGSIYALKNDHTNVTNGYSYIQLINTAYLNRAGGSTVCGPVYFSAKNDAGTSGVSMKAETPSSIYTSAVNKNPYGLDTTAKYYIYQDQCTPKSTATGF